MKPEGKGAEGACNSCLPCRSGNAVSRARAASRREQLLEAILLQSSREYGRLHLSEAKSAFGTHADMVSSCMRLQLPTRFHARRP